MKNINAGFTLIELMIVVAIIGILAAIAIPQYNNYIARTQVAEAMSLIAPVKISLAEHFESTGDFPADGSTSVIGPSGISGEYVSSVEWVKNGAAPHPNGSAKYILSSGDAWDQVRALVGEMRPPGTLPALHCLWIKLTLSTCPIPVSSKIRYTALSGKGGFQ